MKTMTTLLTLALSTAFTLTTTAQEIAGSWQAESISDVEPPKGAALTLAFGDENNATITYTLAGQSQSWDYTYSVSEGQLTLEPLKPFGEPTPVVYDIKFDGDKLHLLTPNPEPVEEPAEEAGETGEPGDASEGDAEAEAGDDADAETEKAPVEEVEEETEEDSRVPVWVLVRA